MIIFVFWRSVYATIFPYRCAGFAGRHIWSMYALGYSLDNLSLMALTISTGFVVTMRS